MTSAKLQGTWTTEVQGKKHEMKFTKDKVHPEFRRRPEKGDRERSRQD